jgi:L-tyrosine isonitrile synthase
MRYQRKRTAPSSCVGSPCLNCTAVHRRRVESFVAAYEPVDFVLPAFPGKSPNRAKVLGSTPDMAEQLSLHFLQSLCDRVQERYAPGARMIICSDGRVFSDLVRIPDADITRYQQICGC